MGENVPIINVTCDQSITISRLNNRQWGWILTQMDANGQSRSLGSYEDPARMLVALAATVLQMTVTREESPTERYPSTYIFAPVMDVRIVGADGVKYNWTTTQQDAEDKRIRERVAAMQEIAK